MTELKRIAESALFMSSEPLTINELTKIMDAESFAVSLKAMEDLMSEYSTRDTAMEIIKLENGKYSMRLKQEYMQSVSHLAMSADFSKAVLRTLGLIAVKQPMRQSFVVKIIGNKAYEYIGELEEKGFLISKKQGSTKILSTTSKFETYFGKQAEDIKKLSETSYQATL